jgi:hypothetical protein
VLFIEYDVTASGEIELVALINAVEDNGEDDTGTDGWHGARPNSTTMASVASASPRRRSS